MNLSISALARAKVCPASVLLGGVRDLRDTLARARGSAIHAYLCDVVKLGEAEAIARVPKLFVEECLAIDLASLPHSSSMAWAVELAMAYDCGNDTAREISRGLGDRDYSSCSDDELPGTADVVGLTADAVVVLDVKTGWARLGRPAESLQLLGYAVAAARLFKRDEAIVGWIRLTDGQPRYEYAKLDCFALDAAAAAIAEVVEAVRHAELNSEPLEPTISSHCTYCPSYLRCPAQATLLAEVAAHAAVDGPVPLDIGTEEGRAALVESTFSDPERLHKFLVRLDAMKKLVTWLDDAVHDSARAKPLLLPGGEVYGVVTMAREKLDALVAQKALADEFGQAFADEAIEVSLETSKAAIKRAATKRIDVLRVARNEPGLKVTHVVTKAVEAIRSAGGVGKSTSSTVKRFTPQPQLPAAEAERAAEEGA